MKRSGIGVIGGAECLMHLAIYMLNKKQNNSCPYIERLKNEREM